MLLLLLLLLLLFIGAGMLLFDRRLGCLDPEIKTDALEYIDAFNQMLASSMKLIVGEKLHQKLNTKLWQQHAKAWDKILSTGQLYRYDNWLRLRLLSPCSMIGLRGVDIKTMQQPRYHIDDNLDTTTLQQPRYQTTT